MSRMVDFKCVLNPYNVYIHECHWLDGELITKTSARLRKSMQVAVELTALLQGCTYTSIWEI